MFLIIITFRNHYQDQRIVSKKATAISPRLWKHRQPNSICLPSLTYSSSVRRL